MPLEDLKFNYKLFLDKSTLIFGESDSGKSTIIKDMAFILKPHIDQVLVISPSDKKNKSYTEYLIPRPCVHDKITDKLLNDMWQRQEALGNIYVRANNINVLKGLFNRVATDSARGLIASINAKKAACINELNENASSGFSTTDVSSKISEIENDANELTIKMYKHFIGRNLDAYRGVHLSRDEKLAIQYLDTNPRLLFILDDCTSELEKFKKHPVVQELFYQGRWSFITLIIAAHTDKSLPPELKTNSFVKIFTLDSAARGYYIRPSTALDKDTKNMILSAISETFTPAKRYQKLVYIRGTNKFYKYTAEKHPPFRFGADIIWQFCQMITSDTENMPNNRFMSKFEQT
jgi:energy-coupling factor transporter ATP-binding protein EcfA2